MNAVIDFYRKSDYSFPASKKSLQRELLREHVVIPVMSGGKERADVNITIDRKQVRCWRIPVRYIDESEEVETNEQ